MSKKEKTPPRLAGRALRAAVAAAESPMIGAGFKQLMFKQMGLDQLLEVDLEGIEVAPLNLPSPHPNPVVEPGSDGSHPSGDSS